MPGLWLLGAALCLLPAWQTWADLIVQDGFDDGGRTNGADPLDVGWFRRFNTTSFSVVTDNGIPGIGSGNALSVDNGQSAMATDSSSIFTSFDAITFAINTGTGDRSPGRHDRHHPRRPSRRGHRSRHCQPDALLSLLQPARPNPDHLRPQQSLLVRALFHLTPCEVGARPEPAACVRDAASPGFALVLTGDDIARTPAALATSLTNDWTAAAIQHALSTVRDSRRVICLEMVDEVSFLWGNTPRPTDGRWSPHHPPLPDDAFVRLMRILHAVPNRPPLTWPVGGIADEPTAHNWMGDPFVSDHVIHYWVVTD